MPDIPLAARVAILETKMEKVDSFLDNFYKTLEVRFRAQAEMLDERFVQVDHKFAQVFTVMDKQFASVRSDIGALQRDITILREGMKILLARLR